MKSSNVALTFLAFMLAAGTLLHGQANIEKLVKESDIVAVAQVISTQQTGSGTVDFPQRQPISADFRLATLELKQIIKGTPVLTTIAVPYTILSTRGAARSGGEPRGYTYRDTLTANSTRLVFLKLVGDRYEFTDGSYLSVVCAAQAGASTERGDLTNRVLSYVSAALFSPNVPASGKAEAISQLASVQSSSVIPTLRNFVRGDVARNDPSLRTAALAVLVAHHDESAYDDAEAQLLRAAPAFSQCNLLLAFTYAVPASRSESVLDHFSDSNAEMRDCVASALRNAADNIRKEYSAAPRWP